MTKIYIIHSSLGIHKICYNEKEAKIFRLKKQKEISKWYTRNVYIEEKEIDIKKLKGLKN